MEDDNNIDFATWNINENQDQLTITFPSGMGKLPLDKVETLAELMCSLMDSLEDITWAEYEPIADKAIEVINHIIMVSHDLLQFRALAAEEDIDARAKMMQEIFQLRDEMEAAMNPT